MSINLFKKNGIKLLLIDFRKPSDKRFRIRRPIQIGSWKKVLIFIPWDFTVALNSETSLTKMKLVAKVNETERKLNCNVHAS